MWKYLVLAYVFVAVTSNAAMAATLEWRNGTAVVIGFFPAASNTCPTNGVNIGDTFNARYRFDDPSPKNERLTLITRRSAHIFGNNIGFAKALQAVDFAGYIGSGLVAHASSTNPYSPLVGKSGQQPKSPSATTSQIYARFKIKNFFVGSGINGCNVVVEVSVLQ
jgi:hypothetical protein